MPTAVKGRSKSAAVSRDVVESAGSFLSTLPEKPKEELSLRESMGHLRESVQAALAKGYSYQDLADLLGKQGINISATTLKNYVPSGKRQAARDKKAVNAQTKGGRTSKTKQEAELVAAVLDKSMESNGSTSAKPAGSASRAGKSSTKTPTKSAPKSRTKTTSRAKSSTASAPKSIRGGRRAID